MMRPLLLTLTLLSTLTAGCGLGDNRTPPRGFAVTWKIADATDPNPETAPALRCADVGIVKVRLDALDRDTGLTHHFDFACDAMAGVTSGVPDSRYQIFLAALDSAGTSRSQIKFDADNFSDHSADLGFVIFTVNR